MFVHYTGKRKKNKNKKKGKRSSMACTLSTRRASINISIICLCNVLGAEQNAPARSKGLGCTLWESAPARCRVPTGEPHHGIRAPRLVPGSSQSPAPLPASRSPPGLPPFIPPSPCRHQGFAILGAAGSGVRHVAGRQAGGQS